MVKTVMNTINKAISFETIPTVNDNLKLLFRNMKLKFPKKSNLKKDSPSFDTRKMNYFFNESPVLWGQVGVWVENVRYKEIANTVMTEQQSCLSRKVLFKIFLFIINPTSSFYFLKPPI